MSEFQREERYIVVKISDIPPGETPWLRRKLQAAQIPTRECVVVEADWPIYEKTWDAVQRMAERKPQLAEELYALLDEFPGFTASLHEKAAWASRVISAKRKARGK
ncbi:hypothetical protein MHM84_01065 [Halomonas sp. McH1-25]|uniref:hypothetical protein n=1 Tax=unclassified Halomonas TaxID=2609666 RepID=UPI001EF3EDDE|nr:MULTISPECIES: hypothetical protein [unclassified Halomonas]MCG7598371.1 hypothetical protein [Halomonas sp. McH1-25]MCP1342687.1 hypothetical protein [Halomonas sp. FL8]MCP1363087.1 hypothetical protein [Halomonas sp. BBD45]MCP1365574.1 hypothetical protein [Halomonas sp. BBD48]